MDIVECKKSYKEFKAELDAEMNRVANGFVRIGYALKVARDTSILYESGYTSVVAFAAGEYNLDKSQVSRFIAINDKFSEDGYSDRIQEQYAAFGYAKLSLMLNLPDAVNELLTPDLSKADVKAIKAEIDEEQKTTDIELMIEQQEHLQEHPEQQEENMLAKAVKSRLHDAPEMYEELFSVVTQAHSVRDVSEVFCPGESKVDMVRIPGMGRLMASYKGPDKNIELVAVRSGEKESYTWQDMKDLLIGIMPGEDVAAAWQQVYGEPFPGKQKVVPVQPERSTVNSERSTAKQEQPKPKEKSKVTRAVVPKPKEPEKPLLHDVEPSIPKPDPVEPEVQQEPEKEVKDADGQIEGQDNIQNHAEWMPEPVIDTTYEDVTEKQEIAPVQQENVQEEPENAQKSPENDQDEEKRVCISDKRKILDKLYVLRQKILNNNKADAAILAEEVVSMIGDWDVEEHNSN